MVGDGEEILRPERQTSICIQVCDESVGEIVVEVIQMIQVIQVIQEKQLIQVMQVGLAHL